MKKCLDWLACASYAALIFGVITGAWWMRRLDRGEFGSKALTPEIDAAKEPALTPMNDWNIRVYAPGDQTEVKSETMSWRLVDGKNTCYIFLQRNAETWIPTVACK